nr:MAG TPA: hypothetical protein [Caudoviricetes sp.]
MSVEHTYNTQSLFSLYPPPPLFELLNTLALRA